MLRVAYHVSRHALAVALVLAFVLALALVIARLSLPRLASTWQVEAQEWLSARIGEVTTVGEIDLQWRGWQLLLQVSDLRVGAGGEHEIAVSTGQLFVDVDLPASIAAGSLRFSGIRLEGIQLRLERSADGRFHLQGLAERNNQEDINLLRQPTWLLAVDWLEVVNSEIVFTDRYRGHVQHRLRNVNLDVRNDGDEHRLSLRLDDAPGLAEQLRLQIHARGEPDDPAAWSISAYLRAEELILPALAQEVPALPALLDGRADLELWLDSEAGVLKRVEGDLDVYQLQPEFEYPLSAPEGWSTRLLLEHQGDQWSVIADWLTVTFAERSWTLPGVAARFRLDDAGKLDNLRAHFATLPVTPTARLLRLASVAPESWNQWLQAAQARGLLRDLELHWWRRPEDQTPGLELRAEIDRFGARPVGKLPGATGVSGVLSIKGDTGLLDLDTRDATLTLPKLLRESLPLQVLEGEVRLTLGESGWRANMPDLVAVTPDIKTRTRLRLDWYKDQGRSPQVDLQVAFFDGDGSQVARYLPVAIMKPRLVAWLDRAIVDGRVPSGGAVFHGPLRGFPFTDRSGTFLVQFGVEDGVLDFHSKWPRAEELIADFTFRRNGMQATASTGRLLSLEAGTTTVAIPWLRKPVIELSTWTNGHFSEMQAFLDASPLKNRIGDKLRELELSGDARLELDLTLPIKGLKPKLEGSVQTRAARMKLRSWSLPLTDIAGQVGFNQLGIYHGRLQAQVFGEPVEVSLDGRTQDDALTTTLDAKGKLAVSPIVEGLLPQLAPHLQGKSNWSARIEWENQTPGTRVELQSQLLGTAVTLPQPLGKNAKDDVPLRVVFEQTATDYRDLEIRYGQTLQLLARLGGDTQAPVLERGALMIGAEPVTMPGEPGLVVEGEVEVLDLDQWMSVFGPVNAGSYDALRRIDVGIGELHANGRVVQGLDLQASADAWTLRVDDPELFGTFRGAIPLSSGPVEAQLDWLRVGVPARNPEPDANRSPTQTMDPRLLPPLRLRVAELWLDQSAVGSLTLHIDPTAGGIELSQLQLAGARFNLQAAGSWIREESAGDISSIDARLTSEDLGQTLRDLGLYADVSGAAGELSLQATWPSPLTAPSLETLAGQLRIDLGEGRFIDVGTGAGALVGLFSLRGLVRRLNLDFGDLQDKGINFDSITADIALADGDATTENLVVDGPQMRLDLSGRVGLVSRDYDQVVLVTPFMGGSLPLAGLLYGGPILGAAGYVAGRVFEEEIGKAARVQYTVGGSWDDPIVERVPITRLELPADWADEPEDR